MIKKTINDCILPSMILERETTLEWMDIITGSKIWRKNPKILVDQEITDKGFMSTTADCNYHFISEFANREIVLYINAPAGTRGIYISNLEHGKTNGEEEILLQVRTTLKISEVKQYNDNYIVKAVIIRQGE